MITRRSLLAATGAGMLLGTGGLRAAGVMRTLTAADVHVADYPTVAAVRWMGEQLEARTSGRLSIHVYHSGQLGREEDVIEMARYGAIDFARVHIGALNNAFPLTRLLALPYVFDSVEHLRRALDGAPGRSILDAFARRGLIGLCIYDSGARCMYNVRHAINEPADLAGLKIRVPQSDVYIDTVGALGANPTPLSYGEVYSALQTHLIDGAENNILSFESSRQFEVARFWSETRHSYAPDALVLSKLTFDSLSPADREILLDVAAGSVAHMRCLWDAAEEKSRAAVMDAGVRINQVDTAAFRRVTAPLLERQIDTPELRSVYASIRNLA